MHFHGNLSSFQYSIEIEKQKAEHDKMVKIAEEKKQVTIAWIDSFLFCFDYGSILWYKLVMNFLNLMFRMFVVALQN